MDKFQIKPCTCVISGFDRNHGLVNHECPKGREISLSIKSSKNGWVPTLLTDAYGFLYCIHCNWPPKMDEKLLQMMAEKHRSTADKMMNLVEIQQLEKKIVHNLGEMVKKGLENKTMMEKLAKLKNPTL